MVGWPTTIWPSNFPAQLTCLASALSSATYRPVSIRWGENRSRPSTLCTTPTRPRSGLKRTSNQWQIGSTSSLWQSRRFGPRTFGLEDLCENRLYPPESITQQASWLFFIFPQYFLLSLLVYPLQFVLYYYNLLEVFLFINVQIWYRVFLY